MELTSRCVVCGQQMGYIFGRPRKLCGNKACYLEWKRRRYTALLRAARSRRLSAADFEYAEPVCPCGSVNFAWTLDGVFCTACGLEDPLFSLERWIPAEFAPKPPCTCPVCRQTPEYRMWASV